MFEIFLSVTGPLKLVWSTKLDTSNAYLLFECDNRSQGLFLNRICLSSL